jgi:hypothetical protein
VHGPTLPEGFIFFDDNLTELERLVMPLDAPSPSAGSGFAEAIAVCVGVRPRKRDNDFA